jgi:glycosyltransferase involved in cell wall biosynthesis
MEKIRVLYIIDSFIQMAGSERNLFEVATGVNRDIFHPVVACMKTGPLLKQLREKGVEVMDLNMSRIYSLNAIRKAYDLFRYMKQNQVQIVVTYHMGSDLWGGSIARLAGVPVIISSRRDMGFMLKKRHILVYRYFNRYFDRILAVSEAVRHLIADTQHALWHSIVTIYNGVELERYDRAGTNRAAVRKALNIPGLVRWPVCLR